MSIACLGWGSLIWRNDGLACDQNWQADGPMLPVEFARQSRNGEVTLVILESVPAVPVQWCRMLTGNLDEAVEQLRVREGGPHRRWIGRWARGEEPKDRLTDVIAAWANDRKLAGVVWTALPAKWDQTVGRVPTRDEVITYLDGLEGAPRDLARNYILNAPGQIATPFRPTLASWAEGVADAGG